LGLSGSWQGPVAGSYEHGNERSVYIKEWEYLDYPSDYRLLKTVILIKLGS